MEQHEFAVDGQTLAGFGIDATPAQAVEHALCEFARRRVDFAVSGINYGENVGESVVTSGTVGAALEAASFGIPAIAASRQTPPEHYFNHDGDVDFSVAAFFLRRLVAAALREGLPPGVDLLKLDVPGDATEETICRWTRVSRQRYFFPVPPKRNSLDHALPMGFEARVDRDSVEADSDVYAVILDRVVSISPLSSDMTARVALNTLTSWCDIAESST